ncbi:MAG TPA: hypothetical protein VFA53_09550 [Xanthobacteraceae bacterium]|nr:hypothetical protein [Xanthobacteraceae bacterium]
MRVSRMMLAMIALCALHGPARADHQPTIIVPMHPGAPIVIDGYDVGWGMAEGDWGLYRPGAVTPDFVTPYPQPTILPRAPHYFPSTGSKPHYGRREVDPPANRPLPKPAESFHRYWMAPADLPPATISEYPGFVMPPVIVTPKN